MGEGGRRYPPIRSFYLLRSFSKTYHLKFIRIIIMRLQGKKVIVTGANGGVGQAISKLFSEEGADVAMVSRVDTAWEVALDALFLASDESSFISGAVLDISGGL
jgi:NAD(P)-dependent dehydrogenase (short-subunit alcohol dehydrogenase family)